MTKEIPPDPTEEFANSRRLIQAGQRNNDAETTNAGIIRLFRLGTKEGFDPTDPIVTKLAGLDMDNQDS